MGSKCSQVSLRHLRLVARWVPLARLPLSTQRIRGLNQHTWVNLGRSVRVRHALGRRQIVVEGFLDEDPRIFSGVYGPWQITKQDLLEVWTYRSCLTVVATTFAIGTAQSIFSFGGPELSTLLVAFGASALGVALVQIHIYIAQIKRSLQLLWAIGVLGGIYVLNKHIDSSLVQYVTNHPDAVWFVGPAFAALSGVTFKEGICYGKLEAFVLTLFIPGLLVGHLSGWMPVEVEQGFSAVISALLLVFAARKYSQDVKDDIGDGSVFAFRKLSAEAQAAKLQKLRNDGETFTRR